MARKKWILAVDDDPGILLILEDVLAHPELTITTASDAMQAFIQARDIAPLLIISDIQMPGYGYGTETLKMLRGNPGTARVPIVFMTGMELTKARALLPADDPSVGLVGKPLDLERLRDYVWKLAGVTAPVAAAAPVAAPVAAWVAAWVAAKVAALVAA